MSSTPVQEGRSVSALFCPLEEQLWLRETYAEQEMGNEEVTTRVVLLYTSGFHFVEKTSIALVESLWNILTSLCTLIYMYCKTENRN
jgi:hypothetical protein